jgi:hypothetical protein
MQLGDGIIAPGQSSSFNDERRDVNLAFNGELGVRNLRAKTINVIPNLFVIGAMKAGTTSLHAALQSHPLVFMSNPKEPAFFIERAARPADLYGAARDEAECFRIYLDAFRGARDEVYLGEASTHYTMRPRLEGCAERIHAFNPNARLIYIVRDPVERSLSHYWWNCQYEEETRSPLEAISEDSRYRDFSNYAMQIQPYLARFSREQIWLMTTESFNREPAKQMAALFGWLGLSSSQCCDCKGHHENVTPQVVVQQRSRLLVALRQTLPYQSIVHMIPKPVRTVARRLNEKAVDRTSVSVAEVKSYLRPMQTRETEELTELFGRPFPEWVSLFAA